MKQVIPAKLYRMQNVLDGQYENEIQFLDIERDEEGNAIVHHDGVSLHEVIDVLIDAVSNTKNFSQDKKDYVCKNLNAARKGLDLKFQLNKRS